MIQPTGIGGRARLITLFLSPGAAWVTRRSQYYYSNEETTGYSVPTLRGRSRFTMEQVISEPRRPRS